MWKYIYDFVFPWNDLIRLTPECGRAAMSEFRSEIFPILAIVMIVFTLFLVWFYYCYLNRKIGTYYTKSRYFAFMALTFVVVVLSSLIILLLLTGKLNCISFGDRLTLSFLNAIYSAIIFFFLSQFFKKISHMGYRTPF